MVSLVSTSFGRFTADNSVDVAVVALPVKVAVPISVEPL